MKESFDALLDHLTSTGFFLEQAVEILERGMIERALAANAGNQSEAARHLGIHRNTLQRKMIQFSIEGKRSRRKPAGRARAVAATSRRRRAS
jgi:DNA-binding NtrC family response regulator